MLRCSETKHRQTIAVLGGTGRFGAAFIDEFSDNGLKVRVLARSPRKVTKRFPQADVRRGNMMNISDVKRTLEGVAAAFLMTPVGGNDDGQIELRAARSAIAAARASQLPHLIFLSLIQPPRPTGVPTLDVKGQIEKMLAAGGLPFSSLRTGCYMDTWLGFFPMFIKLGLYLVPIGPGHEFSFTAQRDVARVAVSLIRQNKVLNRAIDVIEPQTHSLKSVVYLYQAATKQKLIPVGHWLLPVLTILRPVCFRWLYPTGASRVRLFNYFNANDWIGNAQQLAEVLPGFQVTSMKDHLRTIYH